MVVSYKNDGMGRNGRTLPLDSLRPQTASLYAQQQLWERINTEMEVQLSTSKPNL